MKPYLFILVFMSITYAQELQYDYKVKIYPVSNSVQKDKILKCDSSFQKKNVPSSKDMNFNKNLKKEDIRALIYKILKEIETNRKLIKSIKDKSDEKKIIAKLEKIIQDKLYVSRKYTYSYIKKILEEYQNEIISILKEDQNDLKEDLENKIVKTKNDLSSLIIQSSLEVKDNIETLKGSFQQVSTKVDEISQSQEKLKENILSSFNFIKYLLIAISIIIILGFILLGIKINKTNPTENYEEE